MKNLLCAVAVLAVSTAQAAIINVPGDELTIQAGIDAAMNGDEIVVAEGEYFETINFLGKAITLRSSDPLDPMIVANTIINGGGSGSVVTCSSGEGSGTVLNGFLITNGSVGVGGSGGGMYNVSSSPTVSNCTFSGNSADFGGGGMANVDSSSPTVTNCMFIGNTAVLGGGMFNDNSSPTVTNCTFSENSAVGDDGGGMLNNESSPTVADCIFEGNTALSGGGGMHNEHSSPTVVNCRFIENAAGGHGGGISEDGSSPMVVNCTFVGNSAVVGGAMFNDASSPTVINCTFSGNSASQDGGGMYFYLNSSPTVTNCTFAMNSAPNGNALAFRGPDPSTLVMANCILWDGGDEIWNNDGSTINITYSDVQGGWPGAGNIPDDPMFIDPDNGDYRLQAGSLCIDAADNSAVPVGIDTDLDGNRRFVDDPDTPDTGFGNPPIVDMGAYEFQGALPCPWDCDGGESTDGTVGITDFLLLLAQWGSSGSCDFDGGGVGITDFLELLANWGPCP